MLLSTDSISLLEKILGSSLKSTKQPKGILETDVYEGFQFMGLGRTISVTMIPISTAIKSPSIILERLPKL
jgi:hypothetical protein